MFLPGRCAVDSCISEGRGEHAKGQILQNVYVTKTDHLAIISDFELLVPRRSALFILSNGEVRIAIAYTVRSPRNHF